MTELLQSPSWLTNIRFDMIKHPEAAPVSQSSNRNSPWSLRIGVLTVVTLAIAVCVTVLFAVNSTDNTPFKVQPPSTSSQYPTGVRNAAEPSGVSPPSPTALDGYTLTYVSDFTGTSLPSGWNVFKGIPAGDPGGQFAIQHVVVKDGLLRLNTWKDPRYQNRWVTGGLCQCGVAKTYGAYFVRSRITGPGPNEVELLWPASNRWPPEIDFNETGGKVNATSSTLHFTAINQIDQRFVTIGMSQWHTWGLIWTPTSISYVVDGQVWGFISAKSEITVKPMTLDFEQLAFCQAGRLCPQRPVSMLIDWVAEYTPK